MSFYFCIYNGTRVDQCVMQNGHPKQKKIKHRCLRLVSQWKVTVCLCQDVLLILVCLSLSNSLSYCTSLIPIFYVFQVA